MKRLPVVLGMGLLPFGLWVGASLQGLEEASLIPAAQVLAGPAWFHGAVVARSQSPLGDIRSGIVASAHSSPSPLGEARYVSPEAALAQAERVARARRLPEAELKVLVARCTEWPGLKRPGAARVDLIRLNRTLAVRGMRAGLR